MSSLRQSYKNSGVITREEGWGMLEISLRLNTKSNFYKRCNENELVKQMHTIIKET